MPSLKDAHTVEPHPQELEGLSKVVLVNRR